MGIRKGVSNVFPLFRLIRFLMCSINISCPPSINLLSEMIILSGIIGYGGFIFILFFTAAYSLYLYYVYNHSLFNKFALITGCDMITIFLGLFHWLPLNLFIVRVYIFF